MNNEFLTICIISHQQASLVSRLLDSLNEYKPAINFNIVILENVKNSPLVQIDKYDLNIKYLVNDIELGFSENINKVFETAIEKSKYFCILNPDIVFQSDIITDLLNVMDANDIDVISPLVVDKFGVVQDSFRPMPTMLQLVLRYVGISKIEYDKKALPQISYPDWIAAMFLVIKSSVFEQIEGFNTNYKLYFEDVDFCTRAKIAGFKVGVYRESEILHNAQRTSHKKLSYLIWHISSALKFFSSSVYRDYQKNEKTK